ncbi:hypothetical protein LNKW23_37470 [Paralimibaculum aggregatum]|uniref:Uncharacterized protein n=1 Tax=Paralimibaculum aggregatum TaxID=3036245 RepID=A0ABQ6LS42_9RHOB|nr:hypothetical protein [Limibaculum sp. NKW23]GMG84531.1 hypothetical protein LNKW23_37470 [Limibaculum sp. NKW23]
MEREAATAARLRSPGQNLADAMKDAVGGRLDDRPTAGPSRIFPRPRLAADLTAGRLVGDPACSLGMGAGATGRCRERRGAEDRRPRLSGRDHAQDRRQGDPCAGSLHRDRRQAGRCRVAGWHRTACGAEALPAEPELMAHTAFLLRAFVLSLVPAPLERSDHAPPARRRLARPARDRRHARAIELGLTPPFRFAAIGAAGRASPDEAFRRSAVRPAQRRIGPSLNRVEGEDVPLRARRAGVRAGAATGAVHPRARLPYRERADHRLSPAIGAATEIARPAQQTLRRLRIARALGHQGWTTTMRLGVGLSDPDARFVVKLAIRLLRLQNSYDSQEFSPVLSSTTSEARA